MDYNFVLRKQRYNPLKFYDYEKDDVFDPYAISDGNWLSFGK
jgi:hypothetical protein